MERLLQRDFDRLLAALEELHVSTDLVGFPVRVVSALAKAIPADLTGYNRIDTRRGQVIGLMKPFNARKGPGLEILAPHMREHPIVRRRQAGDRVSALKISDFITQRQLHDLGMYCEFYKPLGLEYQMTISLPAPSGIVIGFSVNRRQLDFSERERLLMELLRTQIVLAHGNARAVTRLRRRANASLRYRQATGVLVEENRRGVTPPFVNPRGESCRLTRREAEVLLWVAEGKTNEDVGRILALSPLTIRTHLEHIYEKLGVENRTAAALRAREWLGRAHSSLFDVSENGSAERGQL